MNLGYPAVMLTLPLIAALPALIFRRSGHIQAIVGIASLLILWVSLWGTSPIQRLFPDNMAILVGRGLDLSPLIRILFLFIYPALGLVFGYHWLRPSNPSLVPAGLAMLSPMAASLMVSNKGFGAILMVAAMILLVPALYNGRFQAASAAWRFFLMISVAILPLVVAVWFITIGQPNLPIARVSFLIAALLLLGGFPFFIWIAGLARKASLPSLPLTLGILAAIFVFFLLSQLDDAPAIRSAAEFQAVLLWCATATAILAGFMMLRADSPRELFVYTVVLDMAFMIPVLALTGIAGKEIALLGLIGRFTGLVLVIIGLNFVQEGDQPVHAKPFTGPSNSIQSFATVYGLLTLLGLPLTVGYSGRWAQLTAISAISPPDIIPIIPALMVIAMTLGTFAVIRIFARQSFDRRVASTEENRAITYFTFGILGISIVVGLLPQLITRLVSTLLISF
jgi:formate hydrogenlyase subunit 3/multisubunit Na+/H+ antiporter MnhD subunit